MTIIIKPRPIDWSRVLRDLCGETALVAAIIGQAYYDLCQGDLDAAGYFLSPYYRHHLEILNLPTEWLPEGVQNEVDGTLRVVAIEEQIMELENEENEPTSEDETDPVLSRH